MADGGSGGWASGQPKGQFTGAHPGPEMGGGCAASFPGHLGPGGGFAEVLGAETRVSAEGGGGLLGARIRVDQSGGSANGG